MEFDRYIEETRKLAAYPEERERSYVVHGLVDELGEVKRAVQSCNENGSPPKMGSVHVSQICKEMGDAMWYVARLADHFEINVKKEIRKPIREEEMSFDKGLKHVDTALLAAAEINGHRKKMLRDDADKLPEIKSSLRMLIVDLKKAIHHFGIFNIDTVLEKNLAKLLDRKERGQIHGDGDNR